jgi:hypothetical protein
MTESGANGCTYVPSSNNGVVIQILGRTGGLNAGQGGGFEIR